MSTIGERIKIIRIENELTQKEFAEKISVSRPFISRVEADKEIPSDSLIKLICFTFNISYNWLKFEMGNKHEEKHIKKNFDYLKINENFNFMVALLGTSNFNKTNAFSQAVSVLANIFQNEMVQHDSDEYFIHNVLTYIHCLKSYCIISNNKDYEEDFETLSSHIIENITSALLNINQSFKTENLNTEMEDGEKRDID